MQIIPVIDVLGGQVVRAVAGNRADYLPIQSILTSKIKPKGVIDDLLKLSDFKIIYIAELDSIQRDELNINDYNALFNEFPNLNFWFDYGVRQADDLEIFKNTNNVYPVIGTETYTASNLPVNEKFVLSLDFLDGKPLGLKTMHTQFQQWPQRVVVMSIDNVGTQAGPNYPLIDSIAEKNCRCDLYAAGGVRAEQDLALLAKKNIKGALIASALHNGKIDREVLKRFE